jgi:hypothetical protein
MGVPVKSFLVAAVAALLAPLAVAQHQTFAVNPDASQVRMTLNTTHEVVNGTFHLQPGSIEFDRSSSKMAGTMVVLAGSGRTGNSSRDKKMNKSVLLVDKYTTVSFDPKSYTGSIAASGDSTIQVVGIFTLLGTPHEMTVPMLVHLDGASASSRAHFLIPYVKWGLNNPSFLIWKADDDVTIDLLLTGTLSN